MKIVSWNCGGFNVEKFKEIWRFEPDILLIQECTKKEFDLVSHNGECKYRNSAIKRGGLDSIDYERQHWYGDNDEESSKGIAIFSGTWYTVELAVNFNKEFRYIVPYKITDELSGVFSKVGKADEYILLSIWTKQPLDGSQNYQKTIFDALDYYKFDIPIILAGDFNTGSNKDNLHRYEELKTKLEKYGFKNCAQNTEYEYEPNFFHDKTSSYFTNDFCFIQKNLNVNEFYVDKMNNEKRWHGLSDHCPIIADFR